jgi:exosome complex RNA-binding protein Csl4
MIKIKIFAIICMLFVGSLAGNFYQFKRTDIVKSSVIELKTQNSYLIGENDKLNVSLSKLSHTNSILVSKLDSLKSIITLKALETKSRKIKIHF